MSLSYGQGLSHPLVYDVSYDQSLGPVLVYDVSHDQALGHVLAHEETNYKMLMTACCKLHVTNCIFESAS